MPITRTPMLAGAIALALVLPAAASAAPTAVDVRVEGRSSTIFDGPVTTDGKVITSQPGGAHPCDGSTKIPPVGPGPTPTAALDDAAPKGGFDWAGTWFSFGDYQVDRIGPDAATASEFWGVFVNGRLTDFGGCQVIVQAGDEVLWTFDAFSKPGGALRLTAPAAIQTNQSAVVRVTNIETGAPVAGATVGSAITDADGAATLTFADPGVYTLKADRPDAIRSRATRLCVDPPGAEECTSGDKAAPAIRLDAPRLASDLGRFGGRVPLSWQGDDGAGSGIKRYRVELRRVGEPASAWRPLLPDTASTKGRLNGAAGVSYELRARAFDRALNASTLALATTAIPLDNLSNRVRFSKRGWKVLGRQGAWQLSTSRATRRGASARLRFTGTGATIVTRLLPKGGRVRVAVDGDSKIVSLRGKSRFRRKLVTTGAVAAGEHTLSVTSLGRAPVEIDAIAIRP